MSDRLRRGWPYAVLLALALLIFQRLAFTDLILGRGDTFAYFYPYWGARAAALLEARLPLWTPDLFMGAPLLANPQVGTFYPFNWPLSIFNAPDAVRLSVLLHIGWLLLGAYALARRVIGGGALPALAAALIFGFGGHVGAHIEQINQLQGLAWTPWLFLLYDRARSGGGAAIIALGMGLALQFLAGHAQTVFITGVGLGVYALARDLPRLRAALRGLLPLAAAGLIALPLIAPQLIPMIELTSTSNRGGGLNPNQATAFSLNPLLLGRGLLPSYEGLVFGEYNAYAGVIGLGLALIGAWRGMAARPWLILTAAGLLLALGEFNPLYWILAGLPGFNFFRVPARWLALFALGAALLAAAGLRALLDPARRIGRRGYALIVTPLIALAAISPLAALAPVDVTGPAVPTAITWAGWIMAGEALLLLLIVRGRWPGAAPALLAAALALELALASRIMPYNWLVPPDVYTAQRFTASQLRAYALDQTPPPRILSIGRLLFDPGDLGTLTARYRARGLSAEAERIALVDVKMQEMLAANLPLTWGIPSIDGFDGGVLPLYHYTAFTSLLLPPDSLRTIDGRLREILARPECRGACIPDARWLALTDTGYLITDKVYDLWHEGIAYDTQWRVTDAAALNDLPSFEATALDALVICPAGAEVAPRARFRTGDAESDLRAEGDPLPLDGFARWRLVADAAQTPDGVTVDAPGCVIGALTLVDARTGDFQQLVPDARWRRVLSSDIKLYARVDGPGRAFVVHRAAQVIDDIYGTEEALDRMRDPAFDPAREAVVTDPAATWDAHPLPPIIHAAAGESRAVVTHYSAEQVVVMVEAGAPGFLILADAHYPGWRATVDDAPAPILRANVLVRAVAVPAGTSTVSFSYAPWWLPGVPLAGAAAWALALLALLIMRGRGGAVD